MRFRHIFAAFWAYMNLNLFGSIFVKNDKAAEFVLKKMKCQLSWTFSFFWQKLDQTQWGYSRNYIRSKARKIWREKWSLRFYSFKFCAKMLKLKFELKTFRLIDTFEKQQQKLDIHNWENLDRATWSTCTFKQLAVIKIFCSSFTIVRFTYPS